MGLDEIKVVHFSGDRSLAEWCLGGYIDQISFEDFVSNTIIERMLILLRRDVAIGKGSKRHENVVAERLKDVTHRLAAEWKQQLDSLLTSNSKLREAITQSLNQQQGPVRASRRSVVRQSASSRISLKPRVRKRQQRGKRPRFGRGGYPIGSWVCRKCGNVNYSNRIVCNSTSCSSRR